MSRVYLESEHQELFYPRSDLRVPLDLHVPSALGPLGYYVFLRIPPEMRPSLSGLRLRVRLRGLRPTNVEAGQGDGLTEPPPSYPSFDGRIWWAPMRVPMARGDGTATFSGVPSHLPLTDILFCTWLRFVASGQADAWLEVQKDPLWAPSGVPLGGLGTGRVDICRDGRFRHFTGHNNQDMPIDHPDGLDGAWLSLRCGSDERLLASRPMAGFSPCSRLEFEAAFPRATLRAPDVFPSVDATVTLSGCLKPRDLRISSLPAILVRWELHNRSSRPVVVTCRMAWPNLVGTGGGIGRPEEHTGYGDGAYRYWEAPDAPTVNPLEGVGYRGLRYGNIRHPVCPAADGFHYLAARGLSTDVHVTLDPRRGSVERSLSLPPGTSSWADMVLVWEMPHWIDSLGVERGLFWQNHFRDGAAVVHFLFSRFDWLWQEIGMLGTVFRQTDLPEWMWRRLLNATYPLVTNSVFYRDGRFSINEGPTEMSGVYGTMDQRLAAHPATQLLFPKLNRQELEQFAAVMKPNGEVNHDLGTGHLERGPAGQRWPDVQCSFAIQAARHARTTGEAEFAAAFWPRVRLALERHAQWAEQGGGVAQLGPSTGLGTSYDAYAYEGTTAYLGTLWIAALQIARRWAREVGDGEFAARAEEWIQAARRRLEEDLWNGRYYRACGSGGVASNENAHAGMLAGEYFARLLAGEDVLPQDRLQACAEALATLHGSDRFAMPPDEVTPDGQSGSLYGWMPYIESFCLAPLVLLEHSTRAVAIWERIVRRMDGDGRHPCDTRLMYRPTTGEPSWGAWYMSAPASWLVYEALLDFAYTPADGALRLRPQLRGRFAVIHPLFWGLGRREGGTLSFECLRVFRRSRLMVGSLEVAKEETVHIKGRRLTAESVGPVYARVPLPQVWTLQPGSSLTWSVSRE